MRIIHSHLVLFAILFGTVLLPGYGQQGTEVSKKKTDDPLLFLVVVNDKVGFINKSGKVIIKPKFYTVFDFHEGVAWALFLTDSKWPFKWGLIDKTGKLVILPKFILARQFENGLAWVEVGDKRGYIDKTGKWVWKPTK